MDPHGNHHRSSECELDHECDQEIQEAIQQVPQQVIHPESNGYELDHESGQEVVQQTNPEQNNRSELVHELDEIEPRESNGDEGGHGSSQMNIQKISVDRQHRGYTWPFNLRVLYWRNRYLEEWIRKLLHRSTITASGAVIDDAVNVDLPIEELSLSRTNTLLPKDAGILKIWSMVTREVAGDPCFFILYRSKSPINTIMVECISSDEYQERRTRSSQSTESPQGESSTPRALINFDIDIVIVPEDVLDLHQKIEHWDNIQKLCVLVNKGSSSDRLSPLTMQRLGYLSALEKSKIYVTTSKYAQLPFAEIDFLRYAQDVQQHISGQTSFTFFIEIAVQQHDVKGHECSGRWCGRIKGFFMLLSVLVIVVGLPLVLFLV
ncbi:hypothetical protein BCON_0027g00350 [Botryotinia convoluta]|uniref:Uncharacterized protein n=1 Tax=Botryotinia convoluta TaxID=54673 RepID=A0A4Z1IJ58_9HELO|nr:hypothetical protein BCON_0027g00350 [Botryotinia convoluta]